MQQYFGVKKEDDLIYLNPEDNNHIKNVMRMKKNDEIFVVYEDIKYLCSLESGLITAKIKDKFEENKNDNEVVAYIPVLSDEKLSFIFQKGTELGINKFIVVEFNHCKFKIKKEIHDKKLIRWNKIVKEASEQSHRFDIPVVEKIINCDKIESKDGVNILCSLDTKNVKHINEVLNTKTVHDKITLVFGPEGGLTKAEEDFLVKENFIKTSLGNNILRSETVILYLASVISYLKLGGINGKHK